MGHYWNILWCLWNMETVLEFDLLTNNNDTTDTDPNTICAFAVFYGEIEFGFCKFNGGEIIIITITMQHKI